MKTVISVGIALALMLSIVPAMAGDTDTFQAFSKMAAGEQEILTSLSDEQLATIEGTDFCRRCTNNAVAFNISDIDQVNVNRSRRSDVDQRNRASVYQNITQVQRIN
jgi:hypothetical protein